MGRIVVVVGPPCAGKSTYVDSKRAQGGLRVDFDRLASALGSDVEHGAEGAVKSAAIAAREAVIATILNGVQADAYIVHTSPTEEQVQRYVDASAEFVLVDPGKDECMSRAEGRPDGTNDVIEGWYAAPPAIDEYAEVITDSGQRKELMMGHESVAQGVVRSVKSYVTRLLSPIERRLSELESRPLPEAIKGDPGDPGRDGKDGSSVAVEDVERMVQARMAQWELDFERRAQGVLERAVERMPKPADGKDGRDGVDGKDGVGFDDLAVEHDGERGFTFRLTRGSEVREYGFTIPAVLDRGVYREDNDYLRGDAVSFGGSMWIAQRDLPPGKPGQCDGWRLAVKKGRDGRAA